MESLLEHAGNLRRFAHSHRPLGDRFGDGLDVHGLEVFLVQARARCLARDAQDRDGIGLRRVQPGDHVGARRTGGANTHPNVACNCPRVAFGHMGSALHVAGENVADGALFAQCSIKRIDGGAGYAEGLRYALFLHDPYSGFDCPHFCHDFCSILICCTMG